MNYDYLILYGDSAFSLRRDMPEQWGNVTAATVAVIDTGGTTLQAAAAVTIASATTLNGAATRGRRTITVAGGTWEPGDLLRIADSDSGPPEDVRVESFNASTKVVTLEQRLEASHSTAAAVSCRFMVYSLDASGTSYSNLKEGSIVWDPNTDDQAIRNSFKISTKSFVPSGLEGAFRVAYEAEADDVTDGTWATLEQQAIDELAGFYGPRGGHFMDIVSTSAAEAVILAQIAYNVAVSKGKEKRVDRLEAVLASKKANLETNREWFDDDQDDTREEDELYTMDDPLVNRRW